MTKVTVFAGVCGFTTEIIAEKAEKRKIDIKITSGCEMVRAMAQDILTLDMMVALKGFEDNPVYGAADKHLRHVTCPVPCSMLKALEVEAGLSLPRDVSIKFIKEEE